MRLHAIRFGVAFGFAWGLGMLLMAWGSWLWGWATPMVELFATIYKGYGPTLMGGFIGFIWGFVDFFIFGFLIAWAYNCGKIKCCACNCVNCNCKNGCKCCSTK